MTVPLEERNEVPCVVCGYTYRKTRMVKVEGGYKCADRSRCSSNLHGRRSQTDYARGQRW